VNFQAVAVVVNEAKRRNLFMKKLTRERVVPIISARVCRLILAIIGLIKIAHVLRLRT
jgi:hypothetical protein